MCLCRLAIEVFDFLHLFIRMDEYRTFKTGPSLRATQDTRMYSTPSKPVRFSLAHRRKHDSGETPTTSLNPHPVIATKKNTRDTTTQSSRTDS